MTAQEVQQQVAERIVPQLQELGLVAAVICSYAEDGEGKTTKVTMGYSGPNPAYADGLRSMQRAADLWGRGEM